MPSDKIYTHNPNYVQREVAGEFLLIPIRQQLNQINSLYVLNETGAGIWRLVDGRRTVREIRDALIEEYDVPTEQIQKDLSALFDDLAGIEAITEIAK